MNEGQVVLRRNAARSASVIQRVSKAHAEHINFARGLTVEKWSYRDNFFFLNASNYFIFDKVLLRKSVRWIGKKIGAEMEKKLFAKSFCRL